MTRILYQNEQLAECEVIISVRRDGWLSYEGSAAQLVAEGLIPKDFCWPDAAAYQRWEANGFEYSLRRARPNYHKGSMRTWLEKDNWLMFINVVGRDTPWYIRQNVEFQAEKLRAAQYRATAAGQREWNAKWELHWAARNDKAFQAFKSILVPKCKKPSRKCKDARD